MIKERVGQWRGWMTLLKKIWKWEETGARDLWKMLTFEGRADKWGKPRKEPIDDLFWNIPTMNCFVDNYQDSSLLPSPLAPPLSFLFFHHVLCHNTLLFLLPSPASSHPSILLLFPSPLFSTLLLLILPFTFLQTQNLRCQQYIFLSLSLLYLSYINYGQLIIYLINAM